MFLEGLYKGWSIFGGGSGFIVLETMYFTSPHIFDSLFMDRMKDVVSLLVYHLKSKSIKKLTQISIKIFKNSHFCFTFKLSDQKKESQKVRFREKGL